MTVKGWVCAISIFIVCILLPFAFYHLRAKKVLSSVGKTEPINTVRNQSPDLEQTDLGAFRVMENVTYVSSPGHSMFSVLAFLVLMAFCAFLLYYIYTKFMRWRRAQAQAVVAQQAVVAVPQQAVVVPQAVHQEADLPPSYSAAEMADDRARYAANLRRAGYSGPGRRHRRWRREHLPEMEMADPPCPHHFHDDDTEDMEEMDLAMGEQHPRDRRRIQSDRSSQSTGSGQRQPPLPRVRLSDTEVMMMLNRLFRDLLSSWLIIAYGLARINFICHHNCVLFHIYN
jgi:hypothetical protein